MKHKGQTLMLDVKIKRDCFFHKIHLFSLYVCIFRQSAAWNGPTISVHLTGRSCTTSAWFIWACSSMRRHFTFLVPPSVSGHAWAASLCCSLVHSLSNDMKLYYSWAFFRIYSARKNAISLKETKMLTALEKRNWPFMQNRNVFATLHCLIINIF